MMTFDEVKDLARQQFLATGAHVPMIISSFQDGEGFAVLQSFPDTHDKRMQAMALAGKSVKEKVGEDKMLFKAYFISEAWMSRAKDGKVPDVAPSQDPFRTEVLIISSLSLAKGDADMCVFEIKRDAAGKVTGLEEMGECEKPSNTGELKNSLLEAFFVGFYKGNELPAINMKSEIVDMEKT